MRSTVLKTMLRTVLLLPVVFASCQSDEGVRRDLAENRALYQDSGYRASYTQPRSVSIRPVVDRRAPPPAHGDGVYPRTYTQDHFWARSVTEMLNDVLVREIGGAELFARVVDDPAKADWVLEPSVVAFYGCIEERVVGRTVRGLTKLHVRVLGPTGKDGRRRLLRERAYEAPTKAGGMMFVPDPHALAAASLRRAMVLLMLDLEQGGRKLDGVATEARFEADRVKDWAGASSR